MSVLASQRKTSELEFFNSFITLYNISDMYTSKVPIRRQPYISVPINEILNDVAIIIGKMADDSYGYKFKDTALIPMVQDVIGKLKSLQPYLLAMWNIERFEERKMVYLAQSINHEMEVLAEMACIELDDGDKIVILDNYAIQHAEFVSTMCELQGEIFSKMISSKRSFRNTNGNLLIKLSTLALGCIADGNMKVPETPDDVEHRRECISDTINYLKQMNTPLISYFAFNHCTDRVQTELSGLLAKEIKLLQNLLKSDKKRYAHIM